MSRKLLKITQKDLFSFGIQVVLLLIVIVLFPRSTTGVDAPVVLSMFGLSVISITVHLIAKKEKNWLRIDTVFIVGFLVVNFQWPLMYVISDLAPAYRFQYTSIEAAGNAAVAISAMAIISWAGGCSLSFRRADKERFDFISSGWALPLMYIVSLLFFSYFAGASFFNRSIHTTVTDNLYQTVDGIGAYFFLLSEIISVLALSYVLYRRLILAPMIPGNVGYLKSDRILVILLFIYMAIFIIGGERGQVILIVLGGSLAYAALRRPVSLWLFSLIMVGGFVVFSLIGILRAGMDAGAAGLAYGYWEISTNLAQSIVTLTQSILLVEETGGHFYGLLWVSQILGIVPFLQGIFLGISGLGISDISAAMKITVYTFGENPSSGLGTSFVADVYINSGFFGVIFLSMVYGMICSKMTDWLRGDQGFIRFFVAISFGALIIYITRSSILFQIKPIIWGIAVIFLAIKMRRIA